MSDKYPGGFVTANAPAGFSVAFDGSGDYLSLSSNAVFAFGTGDYTVEAWVYFTSIVDGTLQIVFCSGSTSTNNFSFSLDINQISVGTQVAFVSNQATSFSTGQWYHVAACRASSSLRLFVNGVQVGSTVTDSTSWLSDGTTVVGASGTFGQLFFGYMSNLRVIKGTALYTTTFTPPTQLLNISGTSLLTCNSPTIIDQSTNNFTITANGDAKVSNFTPFAAYQGFNPALGAAAGGVWTLDEAAYYQNNRQWPIYDPYFKNTTLMLHGNGTNGAQNNTFLDSSTNNFTITRNGNTTQGTFTPFSQTGWSNYFPATAVLNNAASTSLALSTSSFTIEGWFYIVSGYTNQSLFRADNGGAVSGLMLYTSSTQLLLYASSNGSSWDIASGTVVGPAPINVWTHLAVARNGNTFTVYVNGVNSLTFTNSSGINQAANIFTIGGGTGGTIVEYISNFRVVIGSAVYTSNFTPSTQPLTAVTNTRLLTCQDNRFVDNSANNLALTATNSPSVQAFSPFVPAYITPTTYSNWFDGSGDSLSLGGQSAFAFGTGDFTIECWIYMSSGTGTEREIIDFRPNTTNGAYPMVMVTAGNILAYYVNTAVQITGTTTVALNTWHHVALARSGTSTKLFLNGIQEGSTYTDTVTYLVGASRPIIGSSGYSGANYFAGVMSNMRVLKGTALYTAAFTPPTAPLTNITNTSLLTCQSSTFIDNSTNAFTITATGNVQPVTSPTPFPAKVDTTTLNSAYSTSLIGGSGYFDGTGDYLITANNAALNVGSGNFCIEAWFYVSTVASQQPIIGNAGVSGSDNTQIDIVSGNIRFASSAAQWLVGGAVTVNSWNHVVVCRTGTTMSLFFNGVRQATTTNSTNFANANNYSMNVGRTADGSVLFTGYISNPRIVKGSTPYDATQTTLAVPTAPLTAITNTSYLLNFTNGAIFDSTAKNVLETIGNAQISTAQSKWGGSSMYFDGTGDYLLLQGGQNFTFGTGDFTIEMWIYVNSGLNTDIVYYDGRPTSTNGVYNIIYTNSTGKLIYSTNSADRITGTTTLSTSTWYHIALSRSGTSTKLFLNGTQEGSTYTDSNSYIVGTNRPVIAGNGFTLGNAPLNGYIDDLRITKGVARYITNFTPPTSQLQDQ